MDYCTDKVKQHMRQQFLIYSKTVHQNILIKITSKLHKLIWYDIFISHSNYLKKPNKVFQKTNTEQTHKRWVQDKMNHWVVRYFRLHIARLHMYWLEWVSMWTSVFVCMFMCVQGSYLVRQRARKSKRSLHAQTYTSTHHSHNSVFVCVCVYTHGPCGWLGCAGLLEGHLEGMWPRVIGVRRDGRGRRQALKGGVGLGVRWGGGHGRRRGVFGAVGAGGCRTAPQTLHAAAQQVVLGLWRNEEKRQWGRWRGREGKRQREDTGRGVTETGA